MEKEKRNFWMETEAGQEIVVEYPDSLKVVPFSPLLERIEQEKPELLQGIIEMYEQMDVNDFQKYINDLIDIKKHEGEMLIITKNYPQKSMIEKEYLQLFRKNFSVDKIRVVCQE